jgi:uncharacterized phage protein (TIGR01671 family)
MNREIKFRAWYADKWTYFTIGQQWDKIQKDIYSLICINGGKFYEYAGIKDKNCVEIYEGDIVRIWTLYHEDYPEESEIFYTGAVGYHAIDSDYPAFDFINYPFACDTNGISDMVWNPEYAHYEVIGNIYENPELIKNS